MGDYKLARLSSQSSDDSLSDRLNFQLQEDFQRLPSGAELLFMENS